ncbi:hypothetical protein RFI_24277, partial [Reticulomyxa filosa]
MDLTTVINNLKHPNYNARYSSISALRAYVKENSENLDLLNVKRLFQLLCNCLLDENWSVTQASPHVLDLSIHLPVILPHLILNLGNNKGIIRRSTLSTLIVFVKQLYSVDLILDTLINVGFIHDNPKVRQGSILVLPQVIELLPSSNTNHLFNALILRLIDENPSVVVSTEQTLAHLSRVKKKEFQSYQNQLDKELLTILTQHHPQIHAASLQQFSDMFTFEHVQ